jgi:neutral ceramidase
MNNLRVGVVGFDITPEIHPEFGAWGTTPILKSIDLPLLARCIVLDDGDCRVVWFGSDLCGNSVDETAVFRDEVAEALGLARQQIIWSTSQTHSSPTVPGSDEPGGSGVTTRGQFDAAYCDAQRLKWINSYKQAAQQAIEGLQPADVYVGKGFCDSMSYNTRFPMPTGGVKFSRNFAEGLQGGKPLGAIFNFCSHPATMINDSMVSPDWVGTAREHIEQALNGAPAMYVQGFCGDVNCYHIFGTPEQARQNGERLGQAAVRAIPHMLPVAGTPLRHTSKMLELACRPMYTRQELHEQIAGRVAFIESLEDNPAATWFCGVNLPEDYPTTDKIKGVEIQIDYYKEGLRLLDSGEPVRTTLELPIGGLRIGDVVAATSAGENFTQTGRKLRERSPFVHTLVCGDTNGLFGYIGDDHEIDRAGYETDSFWTIMYVDGFRLALAKGTVGRILDAFDDVLQGLIRE